MPRYVLLIATMASDGKGHYKCRRRTYSFLVMVAFTNDKRNVDNATKDMPDKSIFP